MVVGRLPRRSPFDIELYPRVYTLARTIASAHCTDLTEQPLVADLKSCRGPDARFEEAVISTTSCSKVASTSGLRNRPQTDHAREMVKAFIARQVNAS